jgi:hypothetical protein
MNNFIENQIRIRSTQFNKLEEYVEVKGVVEKSRQTADNLIRICKFPIHEYEDIVGDGVAEISIVGKSTHYVGLSLKQGKGCAPGIDTFFICPDCNKRSRYLYSVPRGLMCSSCAGLYYEASPQRAARGFTMARHLRYRHGIERDNLKPKGMHNRTFNRLIGRIQALEMDVISRFT